MTRWHRPLETFTETDRRSADDRTRRPAGMDHAGLRRVRHPDGDHGLRGQDGLTPVRRPGADVPASAPPPVPGRPRDRADEPGGVPGRTGETVRPLLGHPPLPPPPARRRTDRGRAAYVGREPL